MVPRYEKKIAQSPSVGIVNGLAVTGPNSGALLEIEIMVIPSKEKGTINITGIVEEESINGQGKSIRRKSLAKGSVENVLTVLRSMGVPAHQYDIHVNFPGGIPIDGPSAGVAMAVGIYSAIFKIPVDNQVTMTGEIGIQGDVKPVGGILAKVKAAKQAGARTVFIPEENMRSILGSIEGIEIIPIQRIEEVLKKALISNSSHDFVFTDLLQGKGKKSV